MSGQAPAKQRGGQMDRQAPADLHFVMDHSLQDYPDPEEPELLVELRLPLAGVMLVIMIVTGIVLAMHYTATRRWRSIRSNASCATSTTAG